MKSHPASSMIKVWLLSLATFFLLPYKLENRTLSSYGFIVLALFIVAFCLGSFLRTKPLPQVVRRRDQLYDFKWLDRLLIAAALVAIVTLAMDLRTKDLSDLSANYLERSDRADALLQGQLSASSIWFQIGFLFYPASNVLIAREIAFQKTIRLGRVILLGFLPILLATLALGGRAPLFYALLVGILSYLLRKELYPKDARQPKGSRNIGLQISFILGAIAMTVYFVNVFFIRSRSDGDDMSLFDVARDNWGISFNGYGSDFFFSALGAQNTYLVFIFIWYLVQSIVMSNVLFTQYTGGMQYGVYGVDLASAVARRVNGGFVAEKFNALLQLNTYGFLPSAFGSLYVDFWFFGLIVCALWGWWAASVYKNFKLGVDQRWIMVAPFASLGIFFSLINTPLGFSNGFVTHVWLFVAFKMIRKTPIAATP